MLEVLGVCKSYNGQRVLAPVSFRLHPGQCLGLSGSNGSGKSTLMRIIAGVQNPDAGDIRFDGVSVKNDRKFKRKRLGYVPQANELDGELTVINQLKLWQSACGVSGDIPQDIIELMGLEELMHHKTSGLSGGQQKRVSIAMALLNDPEIIIMDEATAALDKQFAPGLIERLDAFVKAGGMLIWCSHIQEELDTLSTFRLHFENGVASQIPVPPRK